MTKLSKKDQEWLYNKSCEFTELDGIDNYTAICDGDVEDRLIQKDAEHKSEVDALKVHIDKFISKCSSIIGGNIHEMRPLLLAAYEEAQKQSLAQHDKQVKIDALEILVEQSTFRGFRNSIQPEELDEYINKIKEQ